MGSDSELYSWPVKPKFGNFWRISAKKFSTILWWGGVREHSFTGGGLAWYNVEGVVAAEGEMVAVDLAVADDAAVGSHLASNAGEGDGAAMSTTHTSEDMVM